MIPRRARLSAPAILAAALPAAAHASFLSGEALDTAPTVLAWIVIFVAPVITIGLFLVLHVLPEKIADIRLVEIAGIDLNTCGGTHVRSTAEIEGLKILGTEGMRGGTRLFYAAGVRLRRLLAAHHERSAKLRQLVGTSDEELPAGVSAKLEQLKDAQHAIRALQEELGGALASALAARPDRLVDGHWPGRDLSFLQRIAREVARLAPDKCVFLTAGEGEQGAFVLSAGEQVQIDLAAAGRKVAEILDGRGGGAGRVFQGKVAMLSRRDEALGYLSALP